MLSIKSKQNSLGCLSRCDILFVGITNKNIMSQQINQACASFMHVLPSDIINVIRSFLLVRKRIVGVDIGILNTLPDELPITIRSGIIPMGGGYLADDSIDNDNPS
jgi:hypothetical protein